MRLRLKVLWLLFIALILGCGCAPHADPAREARRQRVLDAVSLVCKAQCPVAHVAARSACLRIDAAEVEWRALCLRESAAVLDACPLLCDAVRARGLLPGE